MGKHRGAPNVRPCNFIAPFSSTDKLPCAATPDLGLCNIALPSAAACAQAKATVLTCFPAFELGGGWFVNFSSSLRSLKPGSWGIPSFCSASYYRVLTKAAYRIMMILRTIPLRVCSEVVACLNMIGVALSVGIGLPSGSASTGGIRCDARSAAASRGRCLLLSISIAGQRPPLVLPVHRQVAGWLNAK